MTATLSNNISLLLGSLFGTEAIYEYNPPQEEFFNTTAEYMPESKEWILNGNKSFVVTGPLPKDTNILFLVIAQTQRANIKGDAARGSSIFLIESNAPGVQLEQQHLTIGCRGVQMRNVKFDNVRLSEGALMGLAHNGNEVAEVLVRCSRLRTSLLGMGVARNLLNELAEYAVHNKQCGVPMR